MADTLSAAWKISPRAAELHASALVWDQTMPWSSFGRAELKQTALQHHLQSGANVVSLTVATDSQTMAETIATIAKERKFIFADPTLRMCETVEDVLSAQVDGKLGVVFNFQGTNAFERNLDLVEVYYRLGVRHALMAYNQKNSVGDGCHERTDGGLSRYGITLVEEMNRVGMMVDVSHTGYRTSMDVFEVSTKPVIFSHANAKALWDHPRNITDDQIDACAKSGGVIGVNGIGIFLSENGASTDLLLKQIDYMVQRIGASHVGIGLDWVYDLESLQAGAKLVAARYPDKGYTRSDLEIAQPEQLPEITEGLLRLGYADDDVRDILGRNWLRMARQLWAR
jgi:membrane dipeptidase